MIISPLGPSWNWLPKAPAKAGSVGSKSPVPVTCQEPSDWRSIST